MKKLLSCFFISLIFIGLNLQAAEDRDMILKDAYQNLLSNQAKIINYITQYYKDGYGFDSTTGYYNKPTKTDLIATYNISSLFDNIDFSNKNYSQFDFAYEELGSSKQINILFYDINYIYYTNGDTGINNIDYLTYARSLSGYKYSKVFNGLKTKSINRVGKYNVMTYILDAEVKNIIDFTAVNYDKYKGNIAFSMSQASPKKLLIDYNLPEKKVQMFIKNKTNKGHDLGSYLLVDVNYYKTKEVMVYDIEDVKMVPKINGMKIKVVNNTNNTTTRFSYHENEALGCTDDITKATSVQVFNKICGWSPEISSFENKTWN